MDRLICNTSPLQYLHQLQLLDFLPTLYSTVIVPEAVQHELDVGSRLGIAVPQLSQLPWVAIVPDRPIADPELLQLGPGERHVIDYASISAGSAVALDDLAARRIAMARSLLVTGTLGILVRLKNAGEVQELRPLLNRLIAFGFRMSPAIERRVLNLAKE